MTILGPSGQEKIIWDINKKRLIVRSISLPEKDIMKKGNKLRT